MANVVVPFSRHREAALLPPVCMSCGSPATHTLKMEFFDKPAVVVPGQEIEYVVVDVPLCEGHPFMGQGRLMVLFGFLLLLPMIGLALLLDSYIHRYVFVFPVAA